MAVATFKILPRNGRIACVILSRACLALPPALSPSTINNSVSSKFDDEQSANLPGSLNFLVEVLRSISFSCFLLFLSSNLLIAMLSKSFALGGFEDSQ